MVSRSCAYSIAEKRRVGGQHTAVNRDGSVNHGLVSTNRSPPLGCLSAATWYQNDFFPGDSTDAVELKTAMAMSDSGFLVPYTFTVSAGAGVVKKDDSRAHTLKSSALPSSLATNPSLNMARTAAATFPPHIPPSSSSNGASIVAPRPVSFTLKKDLNSMIDTHTQPNIVHSRINVQRADGQKDPRYIPNASIRIPSIPTDNSSQPVQNRHAVTQPTFSCPHEPTSIDVQSAPASSASTRVSHLSASSPFVLIPTSAPLEMPHISEETLIALTEPFLLSWCFDPNLFSSPGSAADTAPAL